MLTNFYVTLPHFHFRYRYSKKFFIRPIYANLIMYQHYDDIELLSIFYGKINIQTETCVSKNAAINEAQRVKMTSLFDFCKELVIPLAEILIKNFRVRCFQFHLAFC